MEQYYITEFGGWLNLTKNEIAAAGLNVTTDENCMNVYVYEEHRLTDINDDGIVDMKDISYIARRFGIDPTHLLWDPIADIWKDDVIDMRDIGMVARDFGKTF